MEKPVSHRYRTQGTPGDVEECTAPTSTTSTLMRYGMWVCCAVMLLPVAAYFLTGGSASGALGNLGVFAPIALCVGMHVLMHRFLGRSCHGDHSSTRQGDGERTSATHVSEEVTTPDPSSENVQQADDYPAVVMPKVANATSRSN